MKSAVSAIRRGLIALALVAVVVLVSGCGALVAGGLAGAGEAMQENAERAR
ncbi:hypothetical protein [Spiribacter roseus]|uniref:hypothetical protein n=1 Tax=Spiribacter roseus TaxID=1855875 RepID=UPI00349F6CCB